MLKLDLRLVRVIGGKGCRHLIEKRIGTAQKCHEKVLAQETLTNLITVGFNFEKATEEAVSGVTKEVLSIIKEGFSSVLAVRVETEDCEKALHDALV